MIKFAQCCVGILLGISLWAGSSQAAAPTVADMMEQMNDLENLQSDITVKVSMTQQKVNEGVIKKENVFYRRDIDDSFLMVTIAPETDKGNGYLRVGDNMWMYRRNTRTFQIMNRNESIGGTDAKAGDFEKKKFTELYAPALDAQGNEILTEETLGSAKIPVYRFEVTAKVKDVDYPKQVFWVRQDNFLTLKKESYALSGTLMESSYYPKYTTIDGKYFALQILIVDEFEPGNKTMVEFSGIALKPIDDAVFTKAYLENLSR
jgi:outer membrane lipoprotein-sorting protein